MSSGSARRPQPHRECSEIDQLRPALLASGKGNSRTLRGLPALLLRQRCVDVSSWRCEHRSRSEGCRWGISPSAGLLADYPHRSPRPFRTSQSTFPQETPTSLNMLSSAPSSRRFKSHTSTSRRMVRIVVLARCRACSVARNCRSSAKPGSSSIDLSISKRAGRFPLTDWLTSARPRTKRS